jgi:hypothetical protein
LAEKKNIELTLFGGLIRELEIRIVVVVGKGRGKGLIGRKD